MTTHNMREKQDVLLHVKYITSEYIKETTDDGDIPMFLLEEFGIMIINPKNVDKLNEISPLISFTEMKQDEYENILKEKARDNILEYARKINNDIGARLYIK